MGNLQLHKPHCRGGNARRLVVDDDAMLLDPLDNEVQQGFHCATKIRSNQGQPLFQQLSGIGRSQQRRRTFPLSAELVQRTHGFGVLSEILDHLSLSRRQPQASAHQLIVRQNARERFLFHPLIPLSRPFQDHHVHQGSQGAQSIYVRWWRMRYFVGKFVGDTIGHGSTVGARPSMRPFDGFHQCGPTLETDGFIGVCGGGVLLIRLSILFA